MRWVECGFRTCKEFEKEDPIRYADYFNGLRERAKQSVGRFSKRDELPRDRVLFEQGLL